MNLFECAFLRLTDNGMSDIDADAMLLWWGSVGIGRLWAWQDETPELTPRQGDQLDAASVAWINRGKPQAPKEA